MDLLPLKTKWRKDTGWFELDRHEKLGNGHFPPDNSPSQLGQFPPVPLKTQLENYIYTYNPCMHTCIHIYIYAYTHRCMHTRIYAYNTYMHTYIITYIQAYIYTYIKSYILTYFGIIIHNIICIHTYIHT